MAKVVFLILLMMRSFGAAKAASGEPLSRDEEIRADQWKWEMTRNGWNEKETARKRTRETCEERKNGQGKDPRTCEKRDQERGKEADKSSKIRCAQCFSVEHGKEVHGKARRHLRHVLWDRAQPDKKGDGGEVQQEDEATMEVCSRLSKNRR